MPTTRISPEHRVVLIRIPRSAPTDSDDADAVYEATRQWWRIAAARTDGGPASPTHALAVIGGHVMGAYRIDAWTQRPEDGRRGFTGTPAEGPVAGYVGSDVRDCFPSGAANPVRFLNCSPRGQRRPGRSRSWRARWRHRRARSRPTWPLW